MAFRYTPGVGMEPLGALPGGLVSLGHAINDLGWVTGTSWTTNCISRDCDEHETHIFRYTDEEGMIDVGALSGGRGGYPTAINNLGVIVGSYGGGFTPRRGFIAFDNLMEPLGTLGGNDTMPRDINDHNIVVGQERYSRIGYPQESWGFVWTQAEGMRDLNDLIDSDGAYLWAAWEINNRGQIIGPGWTADGGQGPLLLNPIPPRLSTQLTSSNLIVSWRPRKAFPSRSGSRYPRARPMWSRCPGICPNAFSGSISRLSKVCAALRRKLHARVLFVEDRFQAEGYATRNAIHWPLSILGTVD